MRRRRTRGGTSLLEATLFLPIVAMLLWGMIEFARITYTYYTLHKMLQTVARYTANQPGLNFCDASDVQLVQSKTLALRGAGESGGIDIVTGLTADQILIRAERVDPDTAQVAECDCSSTGCDIAQGGRNPDFIVVSFTDGFSVRPNIPFFNATESFALRPLIRMPVGGN
jgi:TadE-like protein